MIAVTAGPSSMSGFSLLIAVYAVGFVEFWRLCVEAPLDQDDPA